MHLSMHRYTAVIVSVITTVLLIVAQISFANLDETLRYYETLSQDAVTVHSISKRSVAERNVGIKDVTIRMFNRKFRLVLIPGSTALHGNFKVKAISEDGHERQVDIHPHEFYSGSVRDIPRSHVLAHWDEDIFVVTINTDDEIYIVEPLWRHADATENVTMLAYKASDVKYSFYGSEKFCEGIYPEGGVVVDENFNKEHSNPSVNEMDSEAPYDINKHKQHHRYKRAVTDNTCPLMVVADFKFHEALASNGGSVERTAKYLIYQIEKINIIYKTTTFSDQFSGMGFEIKDMIIHEGYTSVTGSQLHYNMNKNNWETKELLETFSRTSSFSNYCLAHLFTHRSFQGGVLGLAYIASPRANAVGGICSGQYYKSGYYLHLNTGWSSSMNTAGKTLLTQEALLVTAHELGHNWGSEHDPETSDCAPDSSNGGRFLMYPYAVSGYETNNKFLSPCSQSYMQRVLNAKSNLCFKSKADFMCGNRIVEPPYEECDAGYKATDTCCDSNCQLKRGFVCSDKNQACCKNCEVAPRGTVCLEATPEDASCEDEATCDGTSFDCPAPRNKGDGAKCLADGECRSGVCVTFCESKNITPCACEIVEDSCLWCCINKKEANPTCKPYSRSKFLIEGSPCVKGYCDKGVCVKTTQTLVVRLWDIIEKISLDKVVAFMRSNIVGTVIVLSLLIWIPGSITISCIDKKKEKKEIEREGWMNSRSRLFIRPEDGQTLRVKNIEHLKLKHKSPSQPSLRRSTTDSLDKHSRSSVVMESNV